MWLLDRPIAHRGLHDKNLPENSMAAFQKAIDNNYYIETDVRLLADGEVVVFHDSNLKRVCGKDVKISSLTTADIKSGNYLLPNGEHIPLFREMLELTKGKTKILLELKWCSLIDHKLEKAVYELIKGMEDEITVQSFRPTTVAWFRKNAPEFFRGFLSSYTNQKWMNPFVNIHNKFALAISKPNFLAYNINSLPSKTIQKLVQKRGINLIAWTVRTNENLITAKEISVDNIIFEDLPLENNEYVKL